MRLIDILAQAVYLQEPRNIIRLCQWEGKPDCVQAIGNQMSAWVNAPYHAQGYGGNYFFWHTINDAIAEILNTPRPE
jgi:hypothetical protein